MLEFSRLNSSAKNWRKSELFNGANSSSDVPRAAAPEEDSGVMISTLIEDAVEAACLGFDHQSTKQEGTKSAFNDHSATLILDIDDARNPDWQFSVSSGSWRRVCLNIVLNALKYTPSGYIVVSLQKKWGQSKASGERTALVELTVGLHFLLC